MGLGGILFILAVLVSLILFIVFIVKAARAWGAFQIVLLSIIFIESWVFMVFTAGVHQERVLATVTASKEAKRLNDAVNGLDLLRYGNASDPDDAMNAVVPVQGKLDRLTIDRGRVWRQVTFIQHTPGQGKDQVQLSLRAATVSAPADPNNPAPAPAPAAAGRSLPANMVLYGFHEQTTPEGQPLPTYYLGEYKVVSSDEATGTATLESTRSLQKFQQDRLKAGTESWTLYELLPIDSHTAFKAEGSSPSDEEVFGRADEEKLKELLAGTPPEVIESYLNDGKRAKDQDAPETIWSLINLTKDLKRDVDSDQNADATLSGYFDQSGRAIDIRLKRGEVVSLDPSNMKDNRIVVIESEAKKMISEGVAQLVQNVYVRPLNDYEELFNILSGRGFEITEKIRYYQHQSSLINTANQDGQTMLAARQKEKQLLEADLSNYKKEIDVLNAAVAEATNDLETLRKELSRMYQEIQGRREKLVSATR